MTQVLSTSCSCHTSVSKNAPKLELGIANALWNIAEVLADVANHPFHDRLAR